MEQHSNQLYGYTHPQLLPHCVCVCVFVCRNVHFVFFLALPKQNSMALLGGEMAKEAGATSPHPSPHPKPN